MDIFIFVLGYIIQLIASGILVYRISSSRSIYGLSVDTQICFLFATVSRFVWTMNTRIMDTNVGLAIVALLEMCLSLLAAVLFVVQFRRLSHTTTMSVPIYLSWRILVPFALVFGYFVNPGDWLSMTSQVLVSFTMYIEAFALIPQLWLIRKMDDVEALTSHYIGLLVIARGVRIIFWTVLAQRFYSLLLADVLHTLLNADYMYLWIRKLRNGGKLVYSV